MSLFQPIGLISKSSNKAQMTLREILAHQAGLTPFIPFLYKCKKKTTGTFVRVYSGNGQPVNFRYGYRLICTKNKNYVKTIYQEIKDSKILPKKEYVYSDLRF